MGTSVGGATVTRHSSGSVMARATGGVGAEPQFRSRGSVTASKRGGGRTRGSPLAALEGEGGDRGGVGGGCI